MILYLRQVFVPTVPPHTYNSNWLLNGPILLTYPSVTQCNTQEPAKMPAQVEDMCSPCLLHQEDIGLIWEPHCLTKEHSYFRWGVFVWSPSLRIGTSSTVLLTRAILRQSTHPGLLQKSFAIRSLYLATSNREMWWESSHRAPRELESRRGERKARMLGWKSQPSSP